MDGKSPEISLKLEIIEDYNNKATPTELSRKYGLAASTISTIVKNQEAIKKASESMREIKKAKRLREPEYKELEKYLDMWFRDTKAHNSITLDGPLIQAQALKISTMLQKPDFKASSGWLNNFLKRHNYRKSQVQKHLQKCYEIVHETTGHKINKFKFYADRGVRPASYGLGDRVWILKESKLKGISRKLSRKWKGPYTVIKRQGEHNYWIKPDGQGKKRLVHVNKLKKCFSPPENVQLESLNDTQTQPELKFSKTIPAPPEISAEPQFSATIPVSFSTPIDPEPMRFGNFSAHLGDPYNQNESYWLDSNYLALEDDAVQDEGKESMFQPNYYLQNQVRNTTTTTNPPQRPIRKRKPPDRYGH
ncbi:tigger transposable element-derived 4 [Brachionus plicatilis]|uniref:Tigger transposable element-derived 4 n=1 Tax=Brachionus plicatilis TaxID=10195 RepID=A0A3M7QY05_BRAPC|nr:tigger transposable element-derived 4 [Brachionus plicatilis]